MTDISVMVLSFEPFEIYMCPTVSQGTQVVHDAIYFAAHMAETASTDIQSMLRNALSNLIIKGSQELQQAIESQLESSLTFGIL